MNSARPQPEQPAFTPWLERAKKHVGADVRCAGSGRWLLQTVDDPKRCFLFQTYDKAMAMVAQPQRCRVIDLNSPTIMETLARMPDRHPND